MANSRPQIGRRKSISPLRRLLARAASPKPPAAEHRPRIPRRTLLMTHTQHIHEKAGKHAEPDARLRRRARQQGMPERGRRRPAWELADWSHGASLGDAPTKPLPTLAAGPTKGQKA